MLPSLVEMPVARWAANFTPAYLAKLRVAMPHDMFVRNGQAMVGDGAAWFDAKGAAALSLERRYAPPGSLLL